MIDPRVARYFGVGAGEQDPRRSRFLAILADNQTEPENAVSQFLLFQSLTCLKVAVHPCTEGNAEWIRASSRPRLSRLNQIFEVFGTMYFDPGVNAVVESESGRALASGKSDQRRG